MRMCSIASGSSGNCIYVGSDNKRRPMKPFAVMAKNLESVKKESKKD